MNENLRRGQIYHIAGSVDEPSVGCEIWSDRPALIVSNDTINDTSGIVEVVYLTRSHKRRASPTHIPVTSGTAKALALCEQVHTVDKSRIRDFIGTATETEMQNIDGALLLSLGINVSTHATGVFQKWANYIAKYHIEVVDEQRELRERIKTDAKSNSVIDILTRERDSYKQLCDAKDRMLDEIRRLIG